MPYDNIFPEICQIAASAKMITIAKLQNANTIDTPDKAQGVWPLGFIRTARLDTIQISFPVAPLAFKNIFKIT